MRYEDLLVARQQTMEMEQAETGQTDKYRFNGLHMNLNHRMFAGCRF